MVEREIPEIVISATDKIEQTPEKTLKNKIAFLADSPVTILKTKIARKEAVVAVVGLGYVGLPTAAFLADSGFQVEGLDINPVVIDGINNDCLETKETGLEKIVSEARKKGLISATNIASEALANADVVIACVQTPVDEQGYANLTYP